MERFNQIAEGLRPGAAPVAPEGLSTPSAARCYSAGRARSTRALAPALLGLLVALASGCASLDVAPSADAGIRSDAPASASRPTAPDAGTSRAAAARPGRSADMGQPPAAAPLATAPVPAGAAATTGKANAPLDVARAPAAAEPRVLSPEANLWDRIRAGFAMPDLPTPLVAEKEQFYLSKPEYLQRMFQRGGRYLYYIVEEVEKRGMPTELALLPFVESAMNPVAMSSAQAAGLWQFIPSTGKAYDLQQNWWVDNRRDVVKSTQAALDYLQKIHAMHGNDWFLALASYNWGEGSVGKAVRKNQAAGRPIDYLSLSMPAETRHYVPKLIAIKHLLLNADALGLKLPDLPNRPYFVTVEKTRPIDLRLAAQFAKMSVDDFVALNPAHNRPVISATRNNQIKLPADRLDQFKAAMATHEADSKAFATWQPYTLKHGETLDALAQRAGVPVSELRRANGLRDGARIVAGTHLLAPQKGIVDERTIENFVAPRVYEQIDRPAVYHTVGKRESLASIAGQYRISAATLKAWNGVKKGIARGMRLLVQPAATQTLLTNESGERSIVGRVAAAPPVIEPVAAVSAPSPAPAPVATPVAAPAPRTAREAPASRAAREAPARLVRAVAVAQPASRKGRAAAAPAGRAPAVAAARQPAPRPAAVARASTARATPVALRAPAARAADKSPRAAGRDTARAPLKTASDRRVRKT